MNFNGKFWHKPGHLGMTTAQLKEALQGGGESKKINIDLTDVDLGSIIGGTPVIKTISDAETPDIDEENAANVVITASFDSAFLGKHEFFAYFRDESDTEKIWDSFIIAAGPLLYYITVERVAAQPHNEVTISAYAVQLTTT